MRTHTVLIALLAATLACQTTNVLTATPTTAAEVTSTPLATASANPSPTVVTTPYDDNRATAEFKTPTPIGTDVTGIIEVTPLGGINWIGDINSPPPPPGVWDFSKIGTYTSIDDWNIRGCTDASCKPVGSISAGQTINTVGATLDNAGAVWLCVDGVEGVDYGIDAHGAQFCYKVFLARNPMGDWYGHYVAFKQ